MKIVLVTGGFDPLHSGHLAYFRAARELGDELLVGINSDAWLTRKKGQPFMPFSERQDIIGHLAVVDGTIEFNDDDDSSIDAIRKVKAAWPDAEIIFANGGDRTADNIPEMVFDDVEFVFGVGGENKANSSSWILQEWKAPKTERPWGYYRILHEVDGTKVKELTVNPGQSLSMQRHKDRAEYWLVTEGVCLVTTEYAQLQVHRHETMKINVNSWHKLSNPYDVPCRIVELQYGSRCVEEDIERQQPLT